MQQLDNPVRHYAWGSRSVIADLLGEPVPSPHPQAEMWLGAHPANSSRLLQPDGTSLSLLDVLNADPDGHLGMTRARHWARKLPYLLKLLAADEPLSLQAHPSSDQARSGFAREEAAGIPRDANHRNYRDTNHKPELICALTQFHALVGFRDPIATVKLVRALNVAELASYEEFLAADPSPVGLRALFGTVLALSPSAIEVMAPAIRDGCKRLIGDDSGFQAEARTMLELLERYPRDPGVLAALMLNRITLAPGDALFLPAGKLHAYLSGVGVELMANSDNVLRGGLTSKHVDLPELLSVLDFTPAPPDVVPGRPDDDWIRYDAPVDEIRLRRWDGRAGSRGGTRQTETAEHVAVPEGGPRIMLCTAGGARLRSAEKELTIRRGMSVWLSASDTGVSVHDATPGTQVFLAADALGHIG